MRFPLNKGLGWGLDIPEISSILFGSLGNFTMRGPALFTIGRSIASASKLKLLHWA